MKDYMDKAQNTSFSVYEKEPQYLNKTSSVCPPNF